jgi:catechol 2,3-dioxygenase-like lactoylglutathione lyase family enzyme
MIWRRRLLASHDTGNPVPWPKEQAVSSFPPITHVALTVRDLSVSVPWYEALLDARPVLDEDTDPDFHHTVYLLGNGNLLGLHQHGRPAPEGSSTSSGSAWTTSPSAAPTGPSWRSGPAGWTTLASPTARSRTPATGRASASATRTGSRSSSSPHPPEGTATLPA